jgi:hypothetical protein
VFKSVNTVTVVEGCRMVVGRGLMIKVWEPMLKFNKTSSAKDLLIYGDEVNCLYNCIHF